MTAFRAKPQRAGATKVRALLALTSTLIGASGGIARWTPATADRAASGRSGRGLERTVPVRKLTVCADEPGLKGPPESRRSWGVYGESTLGASGPNSAPGALAAPAVPSCRFETARIAPRGRDNSKAGSTVS